MFSVMLPERTPPLLVVDERVVWFGREAMVLWEVVLLVRLGGWGVFGVSESAVMGLPFACAVLFLSGVSLDVGDMGPMVP